MSQRIRRKETPDPWVVHPVPVIDTVPFPFQLIIHLSHEAIIFHRCSMNASHFLSLEAVAVITGIGVPVRLQHPKGIVIIVRLDVRVKILQRT